MTGLATEYGEGLYELAREEHLLDELHGELTEIARLLDGQPEFARLLCSRAIERDVRSDEVPLPDASTRPQSTLYLRIVPEGIAALGAPAER